MNFLFRKPLTAISLFSLGFASANAAIVFSEDFETPATDNFTTAAPSNWVKGSTGPFGSNRSGVWDESYTVGDASTTLESSNSSVPDGAGFSTSDGSQAYLLSYYNNNNGITSKEGVIGDIALGDYSLSLLMGIPTNIVDGQFNNAIADITVKIYAIADSGVDRRNATVAPVSATLLDSTVLSSTANALESKTFNFTLSDSQYVGQDLAIQFQADAYDFPLLDAVALDFVAVPEPRAALLGGLGLLALLRRRR